MGIAKRLLAMVEDGRISEDEADELLEALNALRTGREKNGQRLMTFGVSQETETHGQNRDRAAD